MANSSRRYTDRNGKMFIPMNVEGGSWNEHFITTPKLICLIIMFIGTITIFIALKQAFAPVGTFVLLYAIWGLICFYVLRFIIFEENFYYRMYKQLKESEVTTPSLFWDIASLKDNGGGAILTYSDAKIGVILRIERDTITGKPPEFIETHYDAISDFYKEIVQQKYSFVQMNIMEPAGNDPRLDELDKLVYSSDNPNITKLMELQVGYIKNITRHTLYESDYILLYTHDLSKIDSIIDDAVEIAYKILGGAYIGYKVLSSRDIIELVKEEYGVKYFNYTEATLSMFKLNGVSTRSPFELSQIVYTDGEVQDITQIERNKINRMTSDVLNGTLDASTISFKKALVTDNSKIKNNRGANIDFGSLSEGFGVPDGTSGTSGILSKQNVRLGRMIKPVKKDNKSIEEEDEFLDF